MRRLLFDEVWSSTWLGTQVAVLHGYEQPRLPVTPHREAVELGATHGGRLLAIATVLESRDIGEVSVVDEHVVTHT